MAESINMLVNGIKDAVGGIFPGILPLFLILVIGYVAAIILAYIARKALLKLGVDDYIKEKGKIPLKVSSVVGMAIKWYLILILLHVAIMWLGCPETIALPLQNFISFVPRIIMASAVLLLSYLIGIYVKEDAFGDKEIYSSQ